MDNFERLPYLQKAIAATPDVAFATPPIPNPKGDTALITVYAKSSPQDAATADLVESLRASTIPKAR